MPTNTPIPLTLPKEEMREYAYKIVDITNDATFKRIGGYANNSGYSLYNNHHPDIHVLEFDPNNNSILYSGTDGGIHKTV